ncbi:MAG: hypothetical protein RL641_539 [Candidatus Parcubacteria bacterium]|jgi:prepilin-type N-terminal cleavage/methylation domain-containing protein
MRKKFSGFTLVEVMVVIAILVILLAVIFVAINPKKRLLDAKIAQTEINRSSLNKAITMKYAENPGYFSDPACGAGPLPTTPTLISSATGRYNLAPCLSDYFTKIPVNTVDGGKYTDNSNYDTKFYIVRNPKTKDTTLCDYSSLFKTIIVGSQPSSSVMVSNKLYVGNWASNTVSAYELSGCNTAISLGTISVGNGPIGMVAIGTKVYVINYYSSNLSVIDTVSNQNIQTIQLIVGNQTVGSPISIAQLGSKVIIGSETVNDGIVTIVDTANNNQLSRIPLTGILKPIAMTTIGTKVYVANYSSSSVSVIETASTPPAIFGPSIIVGTQPKSIFALNNKLYVANFGSNSVSVIDTVNNSIASPITVGNAPSSISAVDNKIYVANSASNTVSVINAITDTVIGIPIPVGTNPNSLLTLGKKVYVTNIGSSNVSVIDTDNNNSVATFLTGAGPSYQGSSGTNVFILNTGGGSVTVIGGN